MILVVADTSPISILAEIGCLIVLPELFHHVLIPPQVATELVHPKAPAEARAL